MDVPAYTLTRRPRMKNIRMRIGDGGAILVSAPTRTPQRTIDEFVASRTDWIEKARGRREALPQPLEPGPEAERLRREVRAAAEPLIAYWAERMRVPVPDLSVRLMRTRWGSCNKAKQRISLAVELGRRDPELLEYVVVHELTHLIHPNHGPGFYSTMSTYLPDWKEKRRILNRPAVPAG